MTEKMKNDNLYRPCVGIMLFNSKREIFTAKRIDYDSSAWQMPQGGIEALEEPKEAVIRELFEETSITNQNIEYVSELEKWLYYDIPRDIISRLWNGKFKGQKQKWFLYRYIGKNNQINIDTESPEFCSWKWTPVDSLVESIVPFKKEVYKEVVKNFRKYLV